MRLGITLTGVMVGSLACFAVAAASQGAQMPPPVPTPPPTTPSGGSMTAMKPYGKLFQGRTTVLADAQTAAARAALAEAVRKARPQHRCTMNVIPADPQVDPKIRVDLPAAATTKHTLRLIEPPCVTPPRR